MALLWLEGFDYTNSTGDLLDRYPAPGGGTNLNFQTTGGRRGSRGLLFGSTSFLSKALVPGDKRCIIGAAYKLGTAAAMNIFQIVDTGSVIHLELAYQSDGSLVLRRGSGGTVLATSAAGVVNYAAGFFYVELNAYIDDTVGSYAVQVDGVAVSGMSATNVDTRNAGVDGWGRVIWQGNGTVNPVLDDLYVCDGTGSSNNTFLGDTRVDAWYPSGTGSSSMSTPVNGANVAATIDETPVATAPDDYNQLVNVNDYDLVNLGNLNAGQVPYGMEVFALARKADAGIGNIQMLVRYSGVDYPGSAVGLDVSNKYLPRVIFSRLPDNSGPWTEAAFNGIEVGYKRTL